MSKLNELAENKKTARIAGWWYLVLAIGAGYSWMYITKTFVPGSAASTVQNILTTETQYILSIIGSIVGQIGFIFLALALYRLLKNVNQTQARLMVYEWFIERTLLERVWRIRRGCVYSPNTSRGTIRSCNQHG